MTHHMPKDAMSNVRWFMKVLIAILSGVSAANVDAQTLADVAAALRESGITAVIHGEVHHAEYNDRVDLELLEGLLRQGELTLWGEYQGFQSSSHRKSFEQRWVQDVRYASRMMQHAWNGTTKPCEAADRYAQLAMAAHVKFKVLDFGGDIECIDRMARSKAFALARMGFRHAEAKWGIKGAATFPYAQFLGIPIPYDLNAHEAAYYGQRSQAEWATMGEAFERMARAGRPAALVRLETGIVAQDEWKSHFLQRGYSLFSVPVAAGVNAWVVAPRPLAWKARQRLGSPVRLFTVQIAGPYNPYGDVQFICRPEGDCKDEREF
jgi:hypothetical protein